MRDQGLSELLNNHTLVFECRKDIDLITQDQIIAKGAIVISMADDGSLFGYKLGDGEHRYTQLPYICMN